jgi:very-short-patch-repair endonuclease
MIGFCWEGLGNAGEVKVLSSASVEQTLTLMAEAAEWKDEVLVSKTWHQVPAQEVIIEECLGILAQVALSLWPNWYGQAQSFAEGTVAEETWLNRLQTQSIPRDIDPSISTAWLKAVVPLCENKLSPKLTSFPRTFQIQQLIKAISPKGLTLALATDDSQPRSMYLLGLAKAALWLADQEKIRVVLLVPPALAHHEELASVGYSTLELQLPVLTESLDTSVKVVLGQRGSPHPASQVEQLLAKRLESDAELRSLLSFNQPVQSIMGHSFRVDLLWEEGKLIVEIDGDEHRGRHQYTADRQRDYELMISGYLILRISNDQVMSDSELVLQMIRDVVRFRRESQALDYNLGA